jgi:phosphate transport system substrate-binding protein
MLHRPVVILCARKSWCRALTVVQLKRIWQSGSGITSWNEIDPTWPPVRLLLDDADCGTLDYFTDAICGKRGDCRADFRQSSDGGYHKSSTSRPA